MIEALANNGADLIEVGLSFSGPLADGPVIQHATQTALEKGITVKKSLAALKEYCGGAIAARSRNSFQLGAAATTKVSEPFIGNKNAPDFHHQGLAV